MQENEMQAAGTALPPAEAAPAAQEGSGGGWDEAESLLDAESVPEDKALAELEAALGAAAGAKEGGNTGEGRTAPAGTQKAPARDLRAEAEMFRSLFPEVREIPDEVARNVSRGVNMLTAYLVYRDRESRQEAAAREKELRSARQAAKNRERAPVRGVTGGGLENCAQDIFDRAFDAGFQWN